MKSTAELLKEKREAKEISQEFIADKLGISARAYQNYEYGRDVKVDTLVKIAEIMGVHPAELLDEQFVPNKNDGTVSLEQVAGTLDSIQSQLFAHIVRSSERFAKEDKKKADLEMDRIGKYAEQFLKKQTEKGRSGGSQGKG